MKVESSHAVLFTTTAETKLFLLATATKLVHGDAALNNPVQAQKHLAVSHDNKIKKIIKVKATYLMRLLGTTNKTYYQDYFLNMSNLIKSLLKNISRLVPIYLHKI